MWQARIREAFCIPQRLADTVPREYSAPLAFDAQDRVTKRCNSVRTFCTDCSSMLWNWDSEWPDVSGVATFRTRLADTAD